MTQVNKATTIKKSKMSAKNDQQTLYQQALLEHHKSPTGFNKTVAVTHSHHGVNPACGDEITINCEVQGESIVDIGFEGDSCAICRASASLLNVNLVGQPLDSCFQLIHSVNSMFSQEVSFVGDMAEKLSPLIAVKQFPIRQQCAVLPWNTLAQALQQEKRAK